jgi:hypothetical protein
MTWKILIDGDKAKPYKQKLEEIAKVALENTDKLESNIGLMGGKIGAALFFFYYSRFTGDEKYADYGV